jgi:hypothetical protein
MLQLRTAMRALLLSTLFAGLPGLLAAQGLMDGKMRRGGFFIAPGVTYTLPRFSDPEERFALAPDTTFTGTFDPAGKLGLYLEAGWFLATRDPVILDYWDASLAYKQLKGAESFAGTYAFGDSIGSGIGEGAFNDQHVAFSINANRLFTVRDHQFIQFSLGANVDWRFGTSREYAGLTVPGTQDFPPEIIGQFHAKLGYGFKLTQRLMIIPTVETPFFSIVPEDQGFGKLQWFSSTYRPLIFSVRFLFLRYPKGWACPPVKQPKRESKVVNPTFEPKR